jgi:hypothetical protein
MYAQILLKHGTRHAEDIIGFPATAGSHGIDTSANYIVILSHGFIVPDKLLYIGSGPPHAVSVVRPISLKILPPSGVWWAGSVGNEAVHT